MSLHVVTKVLKLVAKGQKSLVAMQKMALFALKCLDIVLKVALFALKCIDMVVNDQDNNFTCCN